jgi:hypothetical protein
MKRAALRSALGSLAVTCVVGIGVRSSATASMGAGAYDNHNHVISFNIRGGDGKADERYNPNATIYNGSNTVQSRIIARWPYAYAVGLQEACRSNYDLITFELTAKGYTAGSGGYRFAYVQSLNNYGIGSVTLFSQCGDWFGNAIAIRGAPEVQGGGRYTTSIQGPSRTDEQKSWLCLRNFAVFCTTHLYPGETQDTLDQSEVFRSQGNAYVAYGYRTFMTGDFNMEPGFGTLAWVESGWRDPDQISGGMQWSWSNAAGTEVKAIDYVWMRNPNGWWADAYLGSASWTDHRLKQGYY